MHTFFHDLYKGFILFLKALTFSCFVVLGIIGLLVFSVSYPVPACIAFIIVVSYGLGLLIRSYD